MGIDGCLVFILRFFRTPLGAVIIELIILFSRNSDRVSEQVDKELNPAHPNP
jgi:hypothetical protein